MIIFFIPCFKRQTKSFVQFCHMILKTSSLTGIRCSEQTEVKHVDNNQIIGPVQEIEHEEDGGEEVHGHPVHPLIRHLYLLSHTPRVSLVIAPLSVNLLRVFTLSITSHHIISHLFELAGVAL